MKVHYLSFFFFPIKFRLSGVLTKERSINGLKLDNVTYFASCVCFPTWLSRASFWKTTPGCHQLCSESYTSSSLLISPVKSSFVSVAALIVTSINFMKSHSLTKICICTLQSICTGPEQWTNQECWSWWGDSFGTDSVSEYIFRSEYFYVMIFFVVVPWSHREQELSIIISFGDLGLTSSSSQALPNHAAAPKSQAPPH